MPLVETERSDGVLTITLCDEARRNALSRELLNQLMDALDEVDNDPDIRVGVVTNRGNVFCAGANLAEQSNGAEGASRTIGLVELFTKIQTSPKPIVGVIKGHCVAGGVGLAAVMDISIALDTSMFGFTEVRVGVAPAMISVVCLPKMRLADAKSAFLRGNRFSAAEAAQMGLINEVAASDDIDDELRNIVNDLLAGAPSALAAAKQLTQRVPSMGADEAFDWTQSLSGALFATDQAREGMAAFLEKRPASWVRRLASDIDE